MPDPSLPKIEKVTTEDSEDVRIVRQWHKNGRLITEIRGKRRANGSFVYHGESRQWSSDGELIGSFTMQDGTGVWRQWFDNGQLFGEMPMVKGQFTGLQRGWDETGYLMVERFWYRGKLVPKKRYQKLQTTDAEIPQYPNEAFATIAQKRKRNAQVG